MKSFADYEKELRASPNAEKLMAAAESEEGRRLSQMFDTGAVEQAAKSGDMAALRGILTQVLSTPDGKALAQKLKNAMEGK